MASLSRLIIGRPLVQLPTALRKIVGSSSKVMIIADAAVAIREGRGLQSRLKASGFQAQLTVFPSGECSKTWTQAGKLYAVLSRARFERQSILVALGGGVAGDLTGFVAATYLRGVPFVQVPTTLLAQVDASIGGKTGIDIPEGKNLVGAFYHPRLIWIDPSLLKTLPALHWRNGLAEVIKYGAIADAKLFDTLERQMDHLLKGYSAEWIPIIRRCADIKMAIVKKDPTETMGLRALLNFGHSLGHAIEAAGGYRDYLHGEAIAIGMAIAGKLSEQLTGLPPIDRLRLEALLTRAGLPLKVKKPIAHARIIEFLSRDKKTVDGTVRFVLLKKLGHALSGQSVPANILNPLLKTAML